MSKTPLLFAVALLLLGGCSLWPLKSGSGGVTTISWYCVNDAATGTQTCQKRKILNGKPVDEVVYETIVIPGDQAPPAIVAPGNHAPPTGAGDAVPWNRQPLATVQTVDDNANLKVENLGPEPRKTRNTTSMWEKQAAQQAAPKAAQGGATAGKNGGYTLQMAAFATQERCNAFIAKQKPAALAVQTREILSRGAKWCIVTHGTYPSEAEAVAASRDYARRYPNQAFWVRSWASIRALEVSQ